MLLVTTSPMRLSVEIPEAKWPEQLPCLCGLRASEVKNYFLDLFGSLFVLFHSCFIMKAYGRTYGHNDSRPSFNHGYGAHERSKKRPFSGASDCLGFANVQE